jgi:elongation factor G
MWGDSKINIIDTPGHVDFTVEVERALRVLDGAVLVLCGVSGVQSQSITVDRQMRRYKVPRVAFINKLDRQGANPWKAINGLRNELKLNASAIQIPIGMENKLEGVIDLVRMEAIRFQGANGETVVREKIPEELLSEAEAKRAELIERVAEVDDELGEIAIIEEKEPTVEQLAAAIRRSTIGLTFVPVFMGSAFKNFGVQALLDGVVDYLPSPAEKKNVALDIDKDETPVELETRSDKPLVALAFKLDEGRFGQLTYMRVYQGKFNRGDSIVNIADGRKIKVPRIVRMHSDEMEEIQGAEAGEILAMFGVDCSSGDTFTDGKHNYSMETMFVPNPVISLSVKPKATSGIANFSKALQRFMKEDPTFRVHVDDNSQETIISGMGELHLEIYVERMKREYKVECVVGAPKVNYIESIRQKAKFDYLHKKQSGGSGQYGKVVGFIEPLPEDSEQDFVFDNHLLGNSIPPEYVTAIEKGFKEAVTKGSLIGMPVNKVRVVLQDGAAHSVDSSEMAFKTAAIYAFRQAYNLANPTIIEPIMNVDVEVPGEFQGTVVGSLNKRKGLIAGSDNVDGFTRIKCEVPLANMFGYSTDLRSQTQGKGEFTMEYMRHNQVPMMTVKELQKKYQDELAAANK